MLPPSASARLAFPLFVFLEGFADLVFDHVADPQYQTFLVRARTDRHPEVLLDLSLDASIDPLADHVGHLDPVELGVPIDLRLDLGLDADVQDLGLRASEDEDVRFVALVKVQVVSWVSQNSPSSSKLENFGIFFSAMR